ncbi:MAG TPA: Rieske (2Fe-2S) protein [Vicinamibacterales bacterium]|nr:Rieske (2Fe-2S) protein [Vicinamibacterales bacterium]
MSDAETAISRRQFCTGACSATLLSLFAGCGSSPSSPSSSASTAVKLAVLSGTFTGSALSVTVTNSALATVGGAALVESNAGNFLLSRTSANAFSAVEAVCTHEGCEITGVDGAEYVCPCHGSRYDRNGHVLAGPAKASLRQYPSSFAGDVVTIPL